MIGKNIIKTKDILIHIFCQLVTVSKNTIKIGKINSAVDKPNQDILKALHRVLSKYLDTVVDEVCDINP